MNKKQLTIRACQELAEKYRNPEGKEFFHSESCPLCPIHISCRGCPLQRKRGVGYGCVDFKTFKKASAAEAKSPLAQKRAFNARARFFDKIIPILEKIPAARFTKKGWTYFEELDRNW